MKKYIIIVSCFPFALLNAQVTNTTNTGNWDDNGKWNNGVPTDAATSTIGHGMTLNQDIIVEGVCTVNSIMVDNPGGDQCKADIKDFGVFTINADVTFEGEVKFSNNSNGLVNGCAVFTVGDLLIENSAIFTISACSKLIVNGNLTIKNDIGIVCHGEIEVNGNVEASNNSAITGSGSLAATGNVVVTDNAFVFGGTSSCSSPPCVYGNPLPIELLSFDAVLIDEEVQLKWITSTEINNDYFTIERSLDAIAWEDITIVSGAGNSNRNIAYSGVDNEPLQGRSYYRLKQTDFDGKFSYFELRAVNFNDKESDPVTIYPSPAISDFSIEGVGIEVDKIRLYSAIGQDVTNQVQLVQNTDSNIKVNFSNLNSGLYYVQTDLGINKLYKQ